ncbi:MAG: dihydrodipicolinate reductase [Rhodothermales bacterium]
MLTSSPLRVIQYGLGPIGLACVRTVLSKADTGQIELVGAIDVDPQKVGRDVGDLLGSGETTGIVVSDDAARTLDEARPDVVLHTTSSFLPGVRDQLLGCVRAGVHVVSSTEELSFPFDRHPALAAELDEAAEDAGVVLVGTGVNPGYAMDTLALTATGVCVGVSRVHVERIVDAGLRRGPLQRKVGAGISEADFEEKKATGKFGHIGLRESLLMIADGLGWPLDAINESLRPMIADRAHRTPHVTVEEGAVTGIRHSITGAVGGEVVISLDLRMYVGAEDPRDRVRVEGDPPVELVVPGGIFGDTATVATLVNTAALVGEARPGLRTMAELPVPRAFATRPAKG